MLVEFDSFQTLNDKQLERMLIESKAFVAGMLAQGKPYWLTLLGTSGAGKTMLARMITRIFRKRIDGRIIFQNQQRIERAHGGFKWWPLLINDVREGEHRMFQDICGDWFVCLDDIGAGHETDFTRTKLYEFINAREGKWTVFTGNLNLEQISERLDPRIASRMLRHGSKVVDVDVIDYNLRK